MKIHVNKLFDEYIMGCGEPERLEIIHTDRTILDSLLNLAHKMDCAPTPEKKRARVIKWCVKYGMPFIGFRNQQTVNFGYIKPMDRFDYFLRKVGYIFFNFDTFVYELLALYRAFALAANLYGVNVGEDRLYKKKSMEHEGSLYDYFEKEHYGWSLEDKELIMCSNIYSQCENGLEIINGKPKLLLFFEDYIETAKYQLMLLILSPNRNGIKRCKCCTNLFACDRANREYCNYCNSKKFYAQEKRKEKKRLQETG